ncbi:Uncharacterized protein FKW44_001343, partial [Caligus rogercresseyi]
MGRLAIISLNDDSGLRRPIKVKNKRSSVKLEHSSSQTNLQYSPPPRQTLPLSYSKPDQ